ncbi:hypothetical protein [Aliiroseovarius marinus]|uniref:hypothetical protein n=1 Tax=Aliiroseovarius marinus TaxID=2500159 RepID=UPI003D7E970A
MQEAASKKAKVLVVGALPQGDQALPEQMVRISCFEFLSMEAPEFQHIAPDFVVSPLISLEFDCLDMAQKLCQVDFPGTYYVLADNLPNPQIIHKEMRTICPALNFEILSEGRLPEGLKSETL